ncbi:MAG: hypothetical protein J7L53_04755 [Deltaproteobacteria bacterium]|nr:hypothetical protein [Deltaproteobacteria bacterium]
MDFTKVTKISRFLDPSQGYAEVQRLSEVRVDPLTGHTTRILDFPIKQLVKVDISSLVEKSRPFCPFCPEIRDQVTPKFSPNLLSKERFTRGEALCVPNPFPYDENGAVTIMTYDHYVALSDFTPDILRDALMCCIEFLGEVIINQPGAIYQSINWNYLPLAGSSIVHPHLQIMASSSSTNYYTSVTSGLSRYKEENRSPFWPDFVAEEKRIGERIIAATHDISWIVAFAPMGAFDIIGVISNASKPADISDTIMDALVSGILNILKFIDSINLYSFNMSIYFLINNESFTPHLRICPRVSLPPFDTSEINYMRMLHNETLTTMKSEEVCNEVKPFFAS